jgi:hypothetical protein
MKETWVETYASNSVAAGVESDGGLWPIFLFKEAHVESITAPSRHQVMRSWLISMARPCGCFQRAGAPRTAPSGWPVSSQVGRL